MNKKYLIGIYLSKQNNCIVAQALYSGKRKYMLCFKVGLSPSGLTQPQNKSYTFAFHGLACVTIQCVRYYIIVLL